MNKEYFKTEEEKQNIINKLKNKGLKAFIVGFNYIKY